MNPINLARSPEIARRRLLGGAVAALAAGLSGACSFGQGAPSTGANGPAGPFRFTDDRGKQISLATVPSRIVAQVSSAAALWDVGLRPIGVFGPRSRGGSYQAGGVDVSRVPSVGHNWGEFNVEQYASLRPELLITHQYGGLVWDIPSDSQATIERIAPMAVVDLTGKSVPTAIDSYARLAGALGADLDTPAVAQAREQFRQASDGLRAAARAKAGLKVLVMTSNKDNVYFARPGEHADLKYLRELGLDLVDPAGKEPFFEMVSWEQVDKYPADLILYDARDINSLWPLARAQAMPTWKQLPGVGAGQVGPWREETPYSYQQCARTLRELTETVTKARPDVVV